MSLTKDGFHSLNGEIRKEDGEEDIQKVGDFPKWSQDLSRI